MEKENTLYLPKSFVLLRCTVPLAAWTQTKVAFSTVCQQQNPVGDTVYSTVLSSERAMSV